MEIPKHIGIILDGNRRFAKKHGWKPWVGHDKGSEKFTKLFDWIIELKIPEVSLYCFSIQNFNRPKDEKEYLFNIFRKEVKKLLTDKRIYKYKVKIKFVGRLHMFPQDLQELMNQVMEKTKNHNNHAVNFAMAYGGREEIVDTVNKLIKDKKKITEENIQKNLWVPNDIDIIIRTSGEFRTSNFLIWQGSYAELFFLNKFWPEFEKQDLINVIKEFDKKRKRRFGK